MNLYELLETTKEQLETILANKHEHYKSFPIAKSSGKLRWLDAPSEELKAIQSQLLRKVFYNFAPHSAAVGFRVGIGVRDGAERHLGNKTLLCMDLKDFFNSITYNNVIKLLYFLTDKLKKHIPEWTYTADDIETMAKLVTYHKALPQGAPTSPALANLVCWKLDQELERLAKENSLIYTRYADDLAFSHKDSKYDIHPLIETITKLIEGDEVTNLLVNTKKTRITRPHRRMTVTGVVINDKLSLAKSFRKNLRARIHNIKKSGITISEKESEVIRGHVEWIYSINPQEGQKFRQAFSGISKESQTT